MGLLSKDKLGIRKYEHMHASFPFLVSWSLLSFQVSELPTQVEFTSTAAEKHVSPS